METRNKFFAEFRLIPCSVIEGCVRTDGREAGKVKIKIKKTVLRRRRLFKIQQGGG